MAGKWNIFLIGILADGNFVENITGKYKSSIFINTHNEIQFCIKLISRPPDQFPNEQLFSGFAPELKPYGFEDAYNEPDHIRIDRFQKFIENYLIVFIPQCKVKANHEVYVASELKLVKKSNPFYESTTLMPLPVFSAKIHNLSFNEFVNRLANRKFVGRINNISIEPNDTPPFLLWKKEDDTYSVIGTFNQHMHAYGGFSFLYENPLTIMDFPIEWLDETYEVNEILFICQSTAAKIMEMLEKEGTPLTELVTSVEDEAAAAAEVNIHPVNTTETKFMNHFIQVTLENGLLYEEKDLINFHTAMKVSNLVILQGMSGTGKSRLVQAYGKALGLAEPNITFIPVRPSWNDDGDLIGYVDSLHQIYRPGDSGLINILKTAEENPDQLFIICFDEMNLARVEHYFSQFLSVLEMEPHCRYLRLYNEELESSLYNAAQYPPRIKIGDNVLFVGTVNMDESTFHFSDKVLDRANIITLKVVPYEKLKTLKYIHHSEHESIHGFMEYDTFRNKNEDIDLTDQQLHLLWDLHQAMQKIHRNLGIGQRIIRQIDRYMKNIPNHPALTKEEAFDLQLVQRVLTKLRGPEELLSPLIGYYDMNEDQLINSRFLDILSQYKDVSSFYETKQTLLTKGKELKINGYTF